MSFAKTEVKLEPLTLELAKEISTMPGLPGERELKTARVKFLKDHVKLGSFVGPGWAVATSRVTGERYRINGQHSSTMLASLTPEAFPQGLLATIDYFMFDSLREDSPGLFNLFDHPRAARTDTDYMGIHRAAHEDLSDIDNPFLVKTTNGIAFLAKTRREELRKRLEAGLESPTSEVTAEEVAKLINHRDHGTFFHEARYREFAIWLWQWHGTKNAAFINRAGIVSEILNDWEKSVPIATEFWRNVMFEDVADSEDDSRQCAEALRVMGVKRQAKQEDFQKRARRHWNRYHRIRELESKKAQGKETGAESTEAAGEWMPGMSPDPSSELRPQL